ncbi:O-fucosyltransferase family protein [Quillaja saponaria]|uniref:O-fucosyltransferase family protein n=1 Tax=Quillaja saponaria TaxID=32244 RepID=A0AAD7PI09_QUISA|nr:O-fucosyltransferase family protein [Quillaja saponaria]
MRLDLRQAAAGVLTFSMFVMLGNMIKRDHFDSIYSSTLRQESTNKVTTDDAKVRFLATSNVQYGVVAITGQSLAKISHVTKVPLKENGETLKPCWSSPTLRKAEQSTGFITFSLTNGPEYHVSQVTDAVVVARYLGATLVFPDIRGRKPVDRMNFVDIYDVQKFLSSLDGLVRVTRVPPAKVSHSAIVKVPNRVSEGYLAKKIEPIYKFEGSLKLESYFPSVNMVKTEENKYLDSFACQAMFGTLQLQPEIQEVVDSMVGRLKTLSQELNSQFVAVDLRIGMLQKKGCYWRKRLS